MTIARGTTAIIINNKTISISQVSIFKLRFPLHLLSWLPRTKQYTENLYHKEFNLCGFLGRIPPILANVFDTIPKQKSLTLYFIQHIWTNYLRHEKNLVMS